MTWPPQILRVLSITTAVLLVSSGCGRGEDPELSQAPPPEPVTFSLADFEVFPDDGDWSATDGGGFRSGGLPKGYVYSRRPIGDGTLRLSYRFEATDDADAPPPNTGLLLFIEEPHKKWPVCVEVQGKQPEAGRVKANGGRPDPQTLHDEEALATAVNPPGEWNDLEVQLRDESLAVRLNGRLTASAIVADWADGPFGLQAEGNVVEFRDVTFTEGIVEESR